MSSFVETIVRNWAPIGVMSFFVMSFIRQSKQVQKLIEELKEERESMQETAFGTPGKKYNSLYYKVGQMEHLVLDLQDQYYELAKKCVELEKKTGDNEPATCPPISLDAIRDATLNKKKVCKGPLWRASETDEESFCLLQKGDL